jgi:hypothetical protein
MESSTLKSSIFVISTAELVHCNNNGFITHFEHYPTAAADFHAYFAGNIYLRKFFMCSPKPVSYENQE